MAKSAEKKSQEAGPEERRFPTVLSRALSPFEDYERLFDDLFPQGWLRAHRPAAPALDRLLQRQDRIPRVDVVDQDKQIIVRAEVPGVDRKDLDISVTDNLVTIKGRVEHESKEEEGTYYRREINRGTFERTVMLPGEVDADNATARFSDGVLELTLPKIKQARRRHIRIE